MLEKRAVAIIQPDLCHCGGLWEARKIAAMAETYYISLAPHNPLGPIATVAAIHFGNGDAELPHPGGDPRRCAVARARRLLPAHIKDGFATLADAPGLGVEVNETEAAKHPFAQEVLMRYFHDDTAVADW